MSWGYEIDARALKELKKLGQPKRERVLRYLDEHILGKEDPRRFGKALRHDFAGLWCYRVGDVRVVCEIKEEEVIVLVIRVGFRRDVYD